MPSLLAVAGAPPGSENGPAPEVGLVNSRSAMPAGFTMACWSDSAATVASGNLVDGTCSTIVLSEALGKYWRRLNNPSKPQMVC